MRLMELCDRSSRSRFSAPDKPWMDVSLLWLSRRTRRDIMFSQSMAEMLFSCSQTQRVHLSVDRRSEQL